MTRISNLPSLTLAAAALCIAGIYGCSSPTVLGKSAAYVMTDSTAAILGDTSSALPPSSSVLYDVPPVPKDIEPPRWPKAAIESATEGEVYLKLWISETGVVKRAIVTKSTHWTFSRSAMQSAMDTRFSPAMIKGKPVATWIDFPVRFRLAR
jgi:TonB family protein